MRLPKSLSLIPLALAATCLAAGFAITGHWAAVPFALMWLLAGWFARKVSNPWAPSLLLAGAVCLAGFGVLSGANAFLMIFSAAAALAGWDLALSEQAMGWKISNQADTRLRDSHLRSLVLALALGLLAAALGLVIQLQISFGVMALLVVIAFLALDQLARRLKGRGSG